MGAGASAARGENCVGCAVRSRGSSLGIARRRRHGSASDGGCRRWRNSGTTVLGSLEQRRGTGASRRRGAAANGAMRGPALLSRLPNGAGTGADAVPVAAARVGHASARTAARRRDAAAAAGIAGAGGGSVGRTPLGGDFVRRRSGDRAHRRPPLGGDSRTGQLRDGRNRADRHRHAGSFDDATLHSARLARCPRQRAHRTVAGLKAPAFICPPVRSVAPAVCCPMTAPCNCGCADWV